MGVGFIVFVIPSRSVLRKLKKKALIITKEKLIYDIINVVELDDIDEIVCKISHTRSLLLVKLKNNECFLKNLKWYERLFAYLSILVYKTPLIINLELLDGEAKANYDLMSKFLIDNDHVRVENI